MSVPGSTADSSGKKALGIVSIVLAVCAWPIGLILSIITVAITPRGATAKTLGWIGLGISVLWGIASIITLATGHGHFWVSTNKTSNP